MRFEKRTPQLRLRLEGWRSRVVLGIAAAGFAVLAGRAFWLQGLNHDFLQQKGEARYGRVVEMPASRGPVKDRNGQPLAVSTPVESIWASPEDFEADAAKLRALAGVLGLDPALFERVKAVWEGRDKLALTTEQARLLEKSYTSFVRGGANLDETAKAEFRKINEELSALTVKFGENVRGRSGHGGNVRVSYCECQSRQCGRHLPESRYLPTGEIIDDVAHEK